MARIAVIHKDRCNPEGCGGYLCIKLCPINRTGKECIVQGPAGKAQIDESLCTGCGICPNRCPFEAISIVNLPGTLEETPIHRYGQNEFSLFSLPTPVFGSVVGVIGRNGIGKSTAIKILAGVQKPNLGKEAEVSHDELIKTFKGSETHKFFERLKKGEIKAAYKPQHVDLLIRTVQGRISDLLRKVDEKGMFDTVIKELALENFLNREIQQVSGGELQRVAIAATVLKDANLYIFDEPTSYLDIKQRLRVSRFIRSLADEKTAVIVIEHDLIALDFMADIVNIMYGKEDVYGIVSQPKPARQAINTYLEGYLKEENVRFRDNKIKFDIKPPVDLRKSVPVYSWQAFKKKLDGFSLSAEPGMVAKHEIVGVLGENGIGKTTFARILAGEIMPDDGQISEGISISYKPQYIQADDRLVAQALEEACNYTNELIKPLGLTHIINKRLSQLSGGELQRVAIASALAKKCDIALLDEPSAYLDVEQRLSLARIIEIISSLKGMSVMVIDHDLVFLDYLAQRLLVFDGEPAIKGHAEGPFSMEQGMNKLLTGLDITLRREPTTGRPRVNKQESRKDREQKSSGKLYYA